MYQAILIPLYSPMGMEARSTFNLLTLRKATAVTGRLGHTAAMQTRSIRSGIAGCLHEHF